MLAFKLRGKRSPWVFIYRMHFWIVFDSFILGGRGEGVLLHHGLGYGFL